jgi:hypothetical protein
MQQTLFAMQAAAPPPRNLLKTRATAAPPPRSACPSCPATTRPARSEGRLGMPLP